MWGNELIDKLRTARIGTIICVVIAELICTYCCGPPRSRTPTYWTRPCSLICRWWVASFGRLSRGLTLPRSSAVRANIQRVRLVRTGVRPSVFCGFFTPPPPMPSCTPKFFALSMLLLLLTPRSPTKSNNARAMVMRCTLLPGCLVCWLTKATTAVCLSTAEADLSRLQRLSRMCCGSATSLWNLVLHNTNPPSSTKTTRRVWQWWLITWLPPETAIFASRWPG